MLARQAARQIRPKVITFLTLPEPFRRPLRTSLYVMSNAGFRRAPGVMTCLARLKFKTAKPLPAARTTTKVSAIHNGVFMAKLADSGPPEPAMAPEIGAQMNLR